PSCPSCFNRRTNPTPALLCERVGGGDDVGVAWEDEEGGAGQWRVGVGADDAAQGCRALPRFDDGCDHAFADAGRVAPLVDHEDAPGALRLAADEAFV